MSVIEYEEGDEHILRRLGCAVVLLWTELPEPVRSQIRERAIHVSDRHHTVQLAQQIDSFIKKRQSD